MKTLKCRPLLVESKEIDNIHNIFKYGSKITKCMTGASYRRFLSLGCIPKQLILISLDPNEKIGENDLYIHFNLNTDEHSLFKADSKFYKDNNPNIIDGRNFVYPYWNKKVIATQSQILPEYIQQFIEEYNKREVKDVEIEMEYIPGGRIEAASNIWKKEFGIQPKLTNGFVTIVKEEPITYTEKEVKDFIKPLIFRLDKEWAEYNFQEWFNNNKKK